MMKPIVIAILFASMITTVPSFAKGYTNTARVTLWDSSDTHITATPEGKFNVAPGQQFRADVYIYSSSSEQNADIAFGWGSTTGTGTGFSDTADTRTVSVPSCDLTDIAVKADSTPIYLFQE